MIIVVRQRERERRTFLFGSDANGWQRIDSIFSGRGRSTVFSHLIEKLNQPVRENPSPRARSPTWVRNVSMSIGFMFPPWAMLCITLRTEKKKKSWNDGVQTPTSERAEHPRRPVHRPVGPSLLGEMSPSPHCCCCSSRSHPCRDVAEELHRRWRSWCSRRAGRAAVG